MATESATAALATETTTTATATERPNNGERAPPIYVNKVLIFYADSKSPSELNVINEYMDTKNLDRFLTTLFDARYGGKAEFARALDHNGMPTSFVVAYESGLGEDDLHGRVERENPLASRIVGKKVHGIAFMAAGEYNGDTLVGLRPMCSIRSTENTFKWSSSTTPRDARETAKLVKRAKQIEADAVEQDESLGRVVERVQYMRNGQGGQRVGTRYMTREITPAAYAKYVWPWLEARTWDSDVHEDERINYDEFRRLFPAFATYRVARSATATWAFDCVMSGSRAATINEQWYGLHVKSFTSDEAVYWSRLSDSDVTIRAAMNWKRQMAEKSAASEVALV